MTSLGEKLKLALYLQFRSLIIVDILNALDDLVMIVFNELLRSHIRIIVEPRIADATQILHKVLPQAMYQPVDVMRLPQLPHVDEPALNPLPIVKTRHLVVLPHLLGLKFIQLHAETNVLVVVAYGVHFLPNFDASIVLCYELYELSVES